MFGCFLNSTYDKVRYKNTVGEEQDVEILISPSSIEDNEVSKGLPKLKIFFYSFSIITLLIFCIALGAFYYSPHIFKDFRNTLWEGCLQPSSDNTTSCPPLDLVRDVIVVTEISNFTSCSDNKTCHSFLDIIEKEHDGMNYNFVIGHRGELYIGAGFKCLVNKEKSALYVKLLKPEFPSDDRQMLWRLNEVINHGLLCDNISPGYQIHGEEIIHYLSEHYEDNNLADIKLNHVHDPDHEVKLVHGNFKWSVCGNFSTTMNLSKERVITWETLSETPCLPLKTVTKVIVDVVETSTFDCSDVTYCHRLFEDHHDGLNYNFIIGHTYDVYVGLGFSCRAENSSDDILKIKVLVPPKKDLSLFSEEHIRFADIIAVGLYCMKISEPYSVKANCSFIDSLENSECVRVFQMIDRKWKIEEFQLLSGIGDNHYNISSEQGTVRKIVPASYGFQFCHSEPSTSTTDSPVFGIETSTHETEKPVTESTPEILPDSEYIDTYIDHNYY